MKIYIAEVNKRPAQAGLTAVPDGFLDRNLADANGEFVKVYLLLLRAAAQGAEADEDKIAEDLQVTVKDVRRALEWWSSRGELELREEAGIRQIVLTPFAGDDPAAAGIDTAGPDNGSGKTAPPAELKKTRPADLKDDAEFSEVLAVVERYVGRRLSASSLEKIAWWYADLKIPADLIEYTVESCVDAGHSSMRYIEAVIVRNWQEGIRTKEQLQERSRIYRSDFYKILKAFGISRQPIDRERKLMECWIFEYGFSLDIITEAAGRSAYKEDPFKYADSILKDWHKSDVRTKKDIEALDEKHRRGAAGKRPGTKQAGTGRRRGFDNFEQRDFDPNQLEEILRLDEEQWDQRSVH